MSRTRFTLRLFPWLGLLAAGSACQVDPTEREAEIDRFQSGLAERLAKLQLGPERVLTLEECEQIALEGNLQYRVSLLEVQLQDDEVLVAFSKLLPQASTEFTHVRRSNDPEIETEAPDASSVGANGAAVESSSKKSSVSFEDQEIDTYRIGAVIPILDFGATRFAWQIAENERTQERLAVVRARQTLLRDVRVSYVRLSASFREVELNQSEVESYQRALTVARSYEREGITSTADTAFVEAGLSRAELDLTLAERDVLLAKARLSRTLSIPSGIDYKVLPLPVDLPTPPDGMEGVRALETQALRRRPEMWSQDLERDIAATLVRQRFAEFFPRLDGMVEFNWSSNSRLVHSSFYNLGFTVADSLLNGTEQLWRYRQAETSTTIEQERALLVAMGVLFEVDFRVLELARAHDGIGARDKLVAARQRLLDQVVSRAREGLESGAEVARALADLHAAERGSMEIRTDYLVAWHELQAAAATDSEEPPVLASEKLPVPEPTGAPPPESP